MNQASQLGIYCTISIVAVVLFFVSIGSPDTKESVSVEISCETEDNCGLMETKTVSSNEKEMLIKDLDRTIRGIALDLDGNRVVGTDENGIPLVNCQYIETESWFIYEDCTVVLK